MQPARVYRGSRRRVRRLKMRGNGSPALYWFAALMILTFLVTVWRMLG